MQYSDQAAINRGLFEKKYLVFISIIKYKAVLNGFIYCYTLRSLGILMESDN